MKALASYLRRLAEWLDPPHALAVRITCDPTRAIASLTELQKAFQDMLDKLDWGIKCNK